MSGRRVAVVTGGGRGIGAAIAVELARTGAHVVTVDPLVSLEGRAESDAPTEPTTAERILAAGGSAEASGASVTDAAQVEGLVDRLVADHGGVDVVVNVAGITRPTSFSSGTEEDWRAVLEVHLDGYLHVLQATLGHMADRGRGRILGVTSGAGWRPGDAGAYSCAKRAVAALTWQLGAVVPDGVSVNALSPVALTRMVTAAMAARQRRSPGPSGSAPSSGGLRLGAGMPTPEQVAPLAAALVDDGADWLRGRVLFGAGSEVAVVDPPRLVEAVGLDDPDTRAVVLDQVVGGAFVPAHDRQGTTGGANPRFGVPGDAGPVTAQGGRVAVVGGPGSTAADVAAALRARGVDRVVHLDPAGVRGASAATAALSGLDAGAGPLEAVVVLADGVATGSPEDDWRGVLASHQGLSSRIDADAAWARAAAELAAGRERRLRLLTVVPAANSGGRSRAQAAAQLARAAHGATDGRVLATAVESRSEDVEPLAELVGHLCVHPDADGLDGAHLVSGDGWAGLFRHPRAGSGIVVGDGRGVPRWFDSALRLALQDGEDR